MKTIFSTIAAVAIASASFAGAAFAEGNYYEGISSTPVAAQSSSAHIDRAATGSVVRDSQKNATPADLSSGDYYSGTHRPN